MDDVEQPEAELRERKVAMGLGMGMGVKLDEKVGDNSHILPLP